MEIQQSVKSGASSTHRQSSVKSGASSTHRQSSVKSGASSTHRTSVQILKGVIELDRRSSAFRKLTIKDSHDRGHWGSKTEFVLSCLGLSVGLGNLWRFPTLAYKNGGAAFFIPYIILQLVIGKPMYFLELSLGQYMGRGPIRVFDFNPAFRGVGIAMVFGSTLISIYYNAVMAYTIYYMFASMQSVLPWTTCKPEWIGRHCYPLVGGGASMPKCGLNVTSVYTDECKCSNNVKYDFNYTTCASANSSMGYSELVNLSSTICPDLIACVNETRTPGHFYFYDEVMQTKGSLADIGPPIWYLVLCLLLSWIIVCLCLLKGVKSSGKVVYFTATFPYVVILALLFRGVTLEGSMEGVKFFLLPKWDKLADVNVWQEAGGQMFFSLSISFGALITLGSYNNYKNNVYIDSLLISVADLVTSFIAGLVIFTTLAAMAYESGLTIETVAESGYGLAFVAYPEAMSRLPAPQFWCIIFFFMLFCLGVDSEFAAVETCLTAFVDEFPYLLKYKMRITVLACAAMFVLGLPICTPGGDYVLLIFDAYGANYTGYFVCFFELVALIWIYGLKRFLNDIETMLGFRPHPAIYWMATWTVIAPATVFVIIILGFIYYEPPEYAEGKPFEVWPQAIGFLMLFGVLVPIPICFVLAVYTSKGETLWKRIVNSTKATKDWKSQEQRLDIIVEESEPESEKKSEEKLEPQSEAEPV